MALSFSPPQVISVSDADKRELESLRAVLKPETWAKQAEIELLESRREIYQADTELDQIATTFKLGFALLTETMMRLFFPGYRLSLHGVMRQILSLPGRRLLERDVEHITLKASPNRATMEAVAAACERVNALHLVRDGRRVRLSVDWGADAREQGAKVPR